MSDTHEYSLHFLADPEPEQPAELKTYKASRPVVAGDFIELSSGFIHHVVAICHTEDGSGITLMLDQSKGNIGDALHDSKIYRY